MVPHGPVPGGVGDEELGPGLEEQLWCRHDPPPGLAVALELDDRGPSATTAPQRARTTANRPGT
jgi:hypothetical protein